MESKTVWSYRLGKIKGDRLRLKNDFRPAHLEFVKNSLAH